MQYYTIKALAELIGCSEFCIHNYINQGKVAKPSVEIGGRRFYGDADAQSIKKTILDEWSAVGKRGRPSSKDRPE